MYKRLFFVGMAVILAVYYLFFITQQRREFISSQLEKGNVFIQVLPVQGPLGWGYDVMVNGKKYIHQPFIPAINGRRGFENEQEALLVGNRVVANMTGKRASPAVHVKDLLELGIPLKESDTVVIK